MIITNGAARLRHIFHAALMRPLDIVPEREKCVRTEGDIRIFIQPCTLFLRRKNSGLFRKRMFSRAVCEQIHILIPDVQVNRIVAVRTPDAAFKWKL